MKSTQHDSQSAQHSGTNTRVILCVSARWATGTSGARRGLRFMVHILQRKKQPSRVAGMLTLSSRKKNSMDITNLLDADPRAAIDCRSCRFFCRCASCEYNKECTNQGPDTSYSGCCGNSDHPGMDGCWCPEGHGCTSGRLTDEQYVEMEE